MEENSVTSPFVYQSLGQAASTLAISNVTCTEYWIFVFRYFGWIYQSGSSKTGRLFRLIGCLWSYHTNCIITFSKLDFTVPISSLFFSYVLSRLTLSKRHWCLMTFFNYWLGTACLNLVFLHPTWICLRSQGNFLEMNRKSNNSGTIAAARGFFQQIIQVVVLIRLVYMEMIVGTAKLVRNLLYFTGMWSYRKLKAPWSQYYLALVLRNLVIWQRFVFWHLPKNARDTHVLRLGFMQVPCLCFAELPAAPRLYPDAGLQCLSMVIPGDGYIQKTWPVWGIYGYVEAQPGCKIILCLSFHFVLYHFIMPLHPC